jgi:hypothetical protein
MLTPREVTRLNLIADAHSVFCPAATHWLVRSMSDALETELEMARRNVREREQRLARQAAIVVEMERDNYIEAGALGRRLLDLLQSTLGLARGRLRGRRASFEALAA